jgi:flagellar protein FlaG
MSIAPVSSLPAAAPASQLTPVTTPKHITTAPTVTATDKLQTDGPTAPTPDNKPEPKEITAREAQQVAEKLNKQLEPANTSVRFSVDDSSGQVVIKVMDTEKDQVIRQIPNEEALAWSQAMNKHQGIILNTKA